MYNVPVAGAWWRAVGAPLDRRVRRRCGQEGGGRADLVPEDAAADLLAEDRVALGMRRTQEDSEHRSSPIVLPGSPLYQELTTTNTNDIAGDGRHSMPFPVLGYDNGRPAKPTLVLLREGKEYSKCLCNHSQPLSGEFTAWNCTLRLDVLGSYDA